MTSKELQNKLYKDYGLSAEDFFKHQHYTILTRSGIEKVMAGAGVSVKFHVEKLERDFAVIKAVASKGDLTVETYGSALKGASFKDGSTNTWYVAEMAEKRSMSRAVLKIEGLYEHGVFGSDESEDFRDDRMQVPSAQLAKAQSAILKGDVTAQEAIDKLEEVYIVPESVKYSYLKLKPNAKS